MTKHSKDIIRENQSRQSKEEKGTLTNYVIKLMEKKGYIGQKEQTAQGLGTGIFQNLIL